MDRPKIRYALSRFVERISFAVVGPMGSGKTTFIKKASTVFDAITIKNYLPGIGEYDSTLAYDHGIVYLKKAGENYTYTTLEEVEKTVLNGGHRALLRVDLWGSAGQLHMRFARKTIIYPKAKALIVFVDLSRPETLPDAKQLLKEALEEIIPVRRGTAPIILIQNKDDKRKVSYTYYPDKLGITTTKNIVCTAKNPQCPKKALLDIVKHYKHYHQNQTKNKLL